MGQSVTCMGALHPEPMFINCQQLSIQISLLPVRKNPQLFSTRYLTAIGFPKIYPLDSDLSGEYNSYIYPAFKQPVPEL